MAKLAGLNFTIHYKKGQDNKVADALSRVEHNAELSAVSGCLPVWIQEIINSYAVDNKAQQLLNELSILSPNSLGYSLIEGLIRYKKRIGLTQTQHYKQRSYMHFIPLQWKDILAQATYQRIKKLLYWQGLKA